MHRKPKKLTRLEEEADRLTKLMRTEGSGYWLGLRRCLRERGVDPATAVLAVTFPDDTDNWYGVIVTPDGRVHDFDYDYPAGRESEGEMTRWDDTTDSSDPALRSLVEAPEQLP